MSPRDTAAAYVEAWKARDSDRFRALLADDAVWEGPTSKAGGAAPRAVANWMTVQDGRVVHVRATSDLTVPARTAL